MIEMIDWLNRFLFNLLGDLLWPERKAEREAAERLDQEAVAADEARLADIAKREADTVPLRVQDKDLGARHEEISGQIDEVQHEDSAIAVDTRSDADLLRDPMRSSDRQSR